MRTNKGLKASRSIGLIRWITAVCLVLGTMFAAGAATSSAESPPTIASDRPDYGPGSTVTLTGGGWQPDETVRIKVNDSQGQTWSHEADVAVGADGGVNHAFDLPLHFVATYDVVATGIQTGRVATTSFTDAAADLDQCENGSFDAPTTDCDWINGNLGASKSHYLEGDSVPYRMTMDGLVAGSTGNTLTIAWDVTQGNKHALDYLTTYDRTVTNANPCEGIAGCDPTQFTTYAIPDDPSIPGTINQIPGVFTLYGGTITAVSVYGVAPGANDCPAGAPNFADNTTDIRCITITFTADVTNPVLAWGGHIATRADWGFGNAAVNISGSPFHMRNIALNGSGGNQDRSLSNAAVIFPAVINIIKHAEPAGPTQFDFTGSPAPVGNFSLTDSDAVTDPVQTFTLDDPTEFGVPYTITESAQPGWDLDSIVCSVQDEHPQQPGSAVDTLATRSVEITVKEGESRTCTFSNVQQDGRLTVIKDVINDDGGTNDADDWDLHVKQNGVDVTGSSQPGSEAPGTDYTLPAGTYDVSEDGGPATGYSFDGFTGDCDNAGSVTVVAGQTVTCTLTNTDDTPTLTLLKDVDNDDGGEAEADDWTLSATSTDPQQAGRDFSNPGGPIGVTEDVYAGVTYTLAETGNADTAGYSSNGEWTCVDGGTMNAAKTTVTVALGEDVTCTITNTDDTPTLTLLKDVDNDDGGEAEADDWTLSATSTDPQQAGRDFSNPGGPIGVTEDVYAGVTYTLAETGNADTAGYSSNGEWTCVDGGTMNAAKTTVTVALGEDVTCTIVNTDDTPTLTLVKDVIGGSAVADDFILSATTTQAGFVDRNFSNPGGWGAPEIVYANTAYDLTETGPAGYAPRPWTCTGGGTLVGSTVELAPGEHVTCTIINDCVKTCPVQPQGVGDDVNCRGVLQGTFNNVVVKPGRTCVLVDSYVNGTLTSDGGRNVLVYDTTIVGDVNLNHITGDVVFGNKDGCNHDPAIGGNLTIRNSHNVLICQTTVCKTVILRNNDGRITVAASAMRRLKVVYNSRFEPDGPVLHLRESAIRLRNINLGTLVVEGNAPRKVLKLNIT